MVVGICQNLREKRGFPKGLMQIRWKSKGDHYKINWKSRGVNFKKIYILKRGGGVQFLSEKAQLM